MSAFVVALTGGAPALAAPPDPVDDGHGREWRQLYETLGVTWNQVAQICPRDGATPCSGTIGPIVFSNWVWGTADQVKELMANYAPAILTANPAFVAGVDFFFPAAVFFNDMRITNFVSGCEVCFGQSATGWTSSDEAGTPVGGGVGMGYPPPSGVFFVAAGGAADQVVPARGIWLWSPSGTDHSPPVITPSVTGTLGSNGWYVSNVTVSWVVQDPESAISATVGCDPVSVTTDTTGTTFTCQATSAGGTSSASVVVKRDVTAPTVTCPSPAPVFQLTQVGALVTASLADATSGPVPPAQGLANTTTAGTFTTAVTGADRAGNRRTVQCPYQVVIPTCGGLAPTIVGTGGNDIINGTNGRDVIVGLGGADTINGMGGDDVICGGDGPDTIDGGAGNDFIDGGASNDDLSGGPGNDTIDGGAGNDSIRGGNGVDTCTSGEIRMSSCEL